MANVAFKKGLLAQLPSTYAEGTFYVTTDERALYLDIDSSNRIRISDFQIVDNIAALGSIETPNESTLYYAEEENTLAKYNGDSWNYINPDTGATSIEVTGSGNAVTAATYDSDSRKITLTKGTTFATPTDVDSKISAKVGEIEGTVKAYVDGKTEGIASESELTELKDRMTTAESDIDTLEGLVGETAVGTQIDNKIAALDLANTYETKGAADEAKTAIIGTTSDASTVDTIKGAKKYADEKATAAETHADEAIAALDVADTPVATQLVSAVSETDGKITVTRRALTADDIPAIPQSKVTDLTTTLAGKQDTLVFNTAYNASTNKAATMIDVQNAVAGLSGAMHYVGESTTDPSTGTATVEGHEDWVSGDVVTYQSKEYVYDGENWRELGDESSYAIKGSIKNADIASDAAIDQSKIANLVTDLAAKATPADITSAIEALDVADEAVAGQLVSAVVETDGKIAVSRRALVATDIPELAQDKITGLTTALAGKQDTITFETTYNASTNKAATMADVNAALTWGSFDDLT